MPSRAGPRPRLAPALALPARLSEGLWGITGSSETTTGSHLADNDTEAPGSARLVKPAQETTTPF